MKFPLYSEIALAENLPKYGFCKGDVGTIVEYYEGSAGNEPGYSVEIFNAIGDVIKVITVAESKLLSLNSRSVLNMREVAVIG